MPANVEQMFSVRQVPWHEEGHVLDDYPQDFEEARKLAGLDWELEEVPALIPAHDDDWFKTEVAKIMLDTTLGAGEQLYKITKLHNEAHPADTGGFRRIARDDTHETLYYGPDSYATIPNAAFGEILQSVIDQPSVKLETGGCLDGGKAVWMLALLDNPVEIPGDGTLTLPYMAITSRHDSKGACALRATAVRIVCANTFGAAEAEGESTGAVYSFRHRGNWRDRIEEAREAVTFARREIREYLAASEALLGIKVTDRQRELFIREFIPTPPDGLLGDRAAKNIDEARAAVRKIIASPTVAGAGIDNTAYGLVQAAGEYLDHVRASKSWETRVRRTLMRHEPLKAKAAQLAREVATADV